VHRRAAIPLSLVWLATVLGTWVLTTASLALLIAHEPADHEAVGGLVGQSTLSAGLACIVVGGPATAVALHVRKRRRPGPAALTGLAVAALVLVFIWSYMAASGTALRDTWSAVTPALVVTAVQLGIAFAVRGRRPEPVQPEPAQEALAEPAPAEAELPEAIEPEPADPAE
jgi:hypothetical protein